MEVKIHEKTPVIVKQSAPDAAAAAAAALLAFSLVQRRQYVAGVKTIQPELGFVIVVSSGFAHCERLAPACLREVTAAMPEAWRYLATVP